MSKRKRDSCSICLAAKRNPTGHSEHYCAFPGGPYAGKLGEARQARKTARQREKAEKPDLVSMISEVQTDVDLYQDENTSKLDTLYASSIQYHSTLLSLKNRVKALEVKLAEVEEKLSAKASVAQGSVVSSVAKGSRKGKGKGKGKGEDTSYPYRHPFPSPHDGGWYYDY